MTEYDLMHGPFSIEMHRKYGKYLDLEVMIAPSGEIEYAMPSHQEFLIERAMQRNGMTRDELMDACPPEYYANFMNWLIPQSGGYIPVWAAGILDYPITKGQASALRRLKSEKLYRGPIPPIGQIRPT